MVKTLATVGFIVTQMTKSQQNSIVYDYQRSAEGDIMKVRSMMLAICLLQMACAPQFVASNSFEPTPAQVEMARASIKGINQATTQYRSEQYFTTGEGDVIYCAQINVKSILGNYSGFQRAYSRMSVDGVVKLQRFHNSAHNLCLQAARGRVNDI